MDRGNETLHLFLGTKLQYNRPSTNSPSAPGTPALEQQSLGHVLTQIVSQISGHVGGGEVAGIPGSPGGPGGPGGPAKPGSPISPGCPIAPAGPLSPFGPFGPD